MVPSGDVADAPKIARAAGAILLQLSAYDYALAGVYAGEKVRIVSPERYVTVARSLLPKLADLTSSALSASANAAGPVRDGVISLADALNDLAKDLGTYSAGADTGAFAKISGDVATAWDRSRALAARLPADPALATTLTRGPSITVKVTSETFFALSAGPYATVADADAAAKLIGAVISVTRAAPFAVRVATYPTKAQADIAGAAIRAKGIDVISVAEERTYTFTRSGTAPDAELWREPSRVLDGFGGARRVALSPDAKWIAVGTEDGTVGIFSAEGVLRALPKFPVGINALLFSGDGAWLFAGGASATVLFVPSGASPLSVQNQIRFPSAITQVLYTGLPTARAFVAVSKGPTGLVGGGGGLVGARAPDGAVLGDPFPIVTPAAGGLIAVTESAEIFIATTSGGSTDVEVLRLGREKSTRGIIKIPGVAVDFALDPKGDRAAVVTDQGTYRFSPHAPDPGATLQRIGPAVRDVAFGADGTLYQMDKDKVAATGSDGTPKWQVPLADGRKLLVGARTLVWDGPDVVWAIAADGAIDALGIDGIVQDLVTSADGKRAAVVLDGRRALVFELQ